MRDSRTGNDAVRGGAPASCETLKPRLSSFEASGELPFTPLEIEHLASCAACRATVASVDPAALFSILALEAKESAFWTGFETRVLATVREEAREPRAGWLGALLRPRTALLAVSALAIGAAVLLVLPRGPIAPAPGGIRASRAPEEGTPGTAQSRIASRGTGAGILPEFATGAMDLLPLERNVASPPPIEIVNSPTARVLTINVKDGGPDEADVVVIVDQGIDI